MKKPRSDSKLKTLPKAAQAKIAAWLDADSQDDVIARIRKDYGVSTSPAALSDFYQWFHLTAQLQEAASFADQLKRDLATIPGLKLDSDQLAKAAQVAFELQALKTKDAKLFIGLRHIRQNQEQLSFERQRFEFDAAKAALAQLAALRAIASDKALSDQDKLLAARKRLFGEVPE
jgi:hypothetical protein